MPRAHPSSPLGSPVCAAEQGAAIAAAAMDARGSASSEEEADLVVINPGDVPAPTACAAPPSDEELLAHAEPAGYEMRQNEQNVTMVVDVEGARRESARLQLSTAEVCVLIESARGWHVARATLAHDIIPAESRLEVHGDFVLVIMRKAVHKAWEVCERDELTPFARAARSPAPSSAAEPAAEAAAHAGEREAELGVAAPLMGAEPAAEPTACAAGPGASAAAAQPLLLASEPSSATSQPPPQPPALQSPLVIEDSASRRPSEPEAAGADAAHATAASVQQAPPVVVASPTPASPAAPRLADALLFELD